MGRGGQWDETVEISGKNNLTLGTPCDSQILGLVLSQNDNVSIEGFAIKPVAHGVMFKGGSEANKKVTLSKMLIRGAPEGYDGIRIESRNENIQISHSLIVENAGNGIFYSDSKQGGPHLVEGNLIQKNGLNGVVIPKQQKITLKNNRIFDNGQNGEKGDGFGIKRRGQGSGLEDLVELIDNVIAFNNGKNKPSSKNTADISFYPQIVGSNDSGNLTTGGTEGVGAGRLSDSDAPVIVLSGKQNFSTKDQNYQFSIQVSDSSPLSLTILHNGEVIKTSDLSALNLWVSLHEGFNKFEVKAVDRFGNESVAALENIILDRVAPVITVALDGPVLTNQVVFGIPVTVEDISAVTTSVFRNSERLYTSSDKSFTAQVTLLEGSNVFQLTAIDAAGNTSDPITVGEIVLDTVAPVLSVLSPVDGGIVIGLSIEISGSASERLSEIRVNGQSMALDQNGMGFSGGIAFVSAGENELVWDAIDIAGNNTKLVTTVQVSAPDEVLPAIPPNPEDVAPETSPSQISTPYDTLRFLFEGTNPIQSEVDPSALNPRRIGLLKGRVRAKDGGGIHGVIVRILGRESEGYTVTRADGHYDLVANGGESMTLSFERPGYATAHRRFPMGWGESKTLDDVVLLSPDKKVSKISQNSQIFQVARGTPSVDEDGERTATLMVPPGVTAEFKGGSSGVAPRQLSIRLTEYTIGADGPLAMPAQLPARTGYTYAVELSVDEALAVGATRVQFSQDLYLYVENFLGFPVGSGVPAGYYDRERAEWIAMPNGRVISVLTEAEGLARVDLFGNGVAASPSELEELGFTDDELRSLAEIYEPGQELWRTPINHFTPCDLNWALIPPLDSVPPNSQPAITAAPLESYSALCGSIIEAENRVLGERLPVQGTPFSLNYRSSRVAGRKAAFTMEIPLTADEIPESLEEIVLNVEIAGTRMTKSYRPAADLVESFQWDGKDAYGRTLVGEQPVLVSIDYHYPSLYYNVSLLSEPAFGRYPTDDLSLSTVISRDEFIASRRARYSLGVFDARTSGLGGWTLDIHHFYDPVAKKLHLGSGDERSTKNLRVVQRVAGTGEPHTNGDGGPALEAAVGFPYDVVTEPDGGYVFVGRPNTVVNSLVIRRVSSDGIISRVSYSIPEGEPSLSDPRKLDLIAVGADREIYIADQGNKLIRKIGGDGVLRTVVGGGSKSILSDGMSAHDVKIDGPSAISISPDGDLYFATIWSNSVLGTRAYLYRLTPAGLVYRVAGHGTDWRDGELASNSRVHPMSDIAICEDGAVYLAEQPSGSGGEPIGQVRRIGADGRLRAYAGGGSPIDGMGDGLLATEAKLVSLQSLACGAGGNLYVGEASRIRVVDEQGLIDTIAGDGTALSGGAINGIATEVPVKVNGIDSGPDGRIYVAGATSIYAVGSLAPEIEADEISIPSASGNEIYVFGVTGKHLRTLDSLTGKITFSFVYDEAGWLVNIVDRNGLETRVERDSGGRPVAIISPYGVRTGLHTDPSGFLRGISDAGGLEYSMSYTSEGLLTSFQKPSGAASTFEYDAMGNLVRDTDARGGFTELLKVANLAETEIRASTAAERSSSYGVRYETDGTQVRRVVDAAGLVTKSMKSVDGRSQKDMPSGLRIVRQDAADPRFSMYSPVAELIEVSTPSGLTQTIGQKREVTLGNPGDLLSVETLLETLSVNGKTTVSVYDSGQRVQTVKSPMGRESVSYFDVQGRVLSELYGNLEPVDYGYNNNGQLTSIFQAGRQERISYSDQGYLSSIENHLGQKTQYEYDLSGRITTQILPDGREVNYSYDVNGNMILISPPGRPNHGFFFNVVDLLEEYRPPLISGTSSVIRYSYNLDRDVTAIHRPDGQSLVVSYDGSSNKVASISTDLGVIGYSYGAGTGHLTKITGHDGVDITQSFDGPLLTSVLWTGALSGQVSSSYNSDFRPAQITVNGSHSAGLFYDDDGLVIQAGVLAIQRSVITGLPEATDLAGQIRTSYSYNSFGELTGLRAERNGEALYTLSLLRDSLGRVVQKTEATGGRTIDAHMSYDPAGRVVAVTRNGTKTSYTYDQNGNRITRSLDGETEAGSYDLQDRLVNYGGYSYASNAAGELTMKVMDATGSTTSFQYDSLGNLQEVKLPGGRVVSYTIDGRGLRVGKMIDGSFKQGLLYKDQLNPVAELAADGNLRSLFVYGTKHHVPEYMVSSAGVVHSLISDDLGSVRLVVNSSTGAVAQLLEYDEYGRVSVDTNPGFQPFGFAGGLYDPDTKLVKYGARDYDPETGRWTSKDPILFNAGDTNLFGYVANDPINAIDPSGLYQVCTRPLIGLDSEFGPLYHQYLCANGVCGGQTTSGGMWHSPGKDSRDPPPGSPGVSCEDGAKDNIDCVDKCIEEAIGGPRPIYSVINIGGVNCQQWANETVARCAAKCGGK